jgi:hypothetical protein
VISLERPWLEHQAVAIEKNFTATFISYRLLKFLRLDSKSIQICHFIMKVDSTVNGKAHYKIHDVSEALQSPNF